MIDPFLLLAPILLLPVASLLAFTGCDIIARLDPLNPPAAILLRINCGGPGVMDAELGWTSDAALASGGQSQSNTLVSPVQDPATGQPAGMIYETCREGDSNGFSYNNLAITPGDYQLTLKFAVIDNNPNIIGVFRYRINGAPSTIDSGAIGLGQKFDVTQPLHIDPGGSLTLVFEEDQPAHGVFPFVNAIEVGAMQ